MNRSPRLSSQGRVRWQGRRRRRALGLLPGLCAVLLAAGPARAVETIRLRLTLVPELFTVKVAELRSPDALLAGNSDLAELDRASDGEIGRRLARAMGSPLPLRLRDVLTNALGSPLLEQVLLMVAAVGEVDGVTQPATAEAAQLEQALRRVAARGDGLTLPDALAMLPGQAVTIDLNRLVFALKRLQTQQAAAVPLLGAVPPVAADAVYSQAGNRQVLRRTLDLPASHRSVPLPLVVIEPGDRANGRLVVISHGLWDRPASFEGWARHLASHGYTVVLPHHPGSDSSQQLAMLSGKVPPPGPAELVARPRDVSAVIDAAAGGRLGLRSSVDTDQVLVAGHSWGATTALQLAGGQPSSKDLRRYCDDLDDPARNLSWVLQCSFLATADRTGLADPRVKAVVAVSPPMRLLFVPGSGSLLNARVLLVSGTQDWVVPVGPEAIDPTRTKTRDSGIGDNRLVLAEGGDHFNLRAPATGDGTPLKGMIHAWFDGPAAWSGSGWGDPGIPLRDVTTRAIQGINTTGPAPVAPAPAAVPISAPAGSSR